MTQSVRPFMAPKATDDFDQLVEELGRVGWRLLECAASLAVCKEPTRTESFAT